MRIIIFWGLCWGPPILGNYHIGINRGLGSRVHGDMYGLTELNSGERNEKGTGH